MDLQLVGVDEGVAVVAAGTGQLRGASRILHLPSILRHGDVSVFKVVDVQSLFNQRASRTYYDMVGM